MYIQKIFRPVLLIIIAIMLMVNPLNVIASAGALEDVRTLVKERYVDIVSDDILGSSTIEDIIGQLGDPHSRYLTAKEYQSFVNSLNMSFSGIGIYMDIVPPGVKVTSVIKGSPAEEVGLKSGDVIITAAGQSLAGISAEGAASILRGLEGSSIELTVRRGEEEFRVTVTRRSIEMPTVNGEVLNGHIGYIEILSFGSNTSELFGKTVADLKAKNVDSWVIDLRDNPGGYLDSVIDLAGYFIGTKVVVQTKDRSGTVSYPAKDHSTWNQPTVFLTNQNSASASEILTAAMKDYSKATIIGTKTYGKGTVQSMFSLSDGGVLKLTVARFFSPFGNVIDKEGIRPHISLLGADAKSAAQLLLGEVSHESGDKAGKIKIMSGPNIFEFSLAKARSEEYWQPYYEILNGVGSSSNLKKGSANGFLSVSDSELEKRWPLFFPGYKELNQLKDIPLDKKFTVRFSRSIDWSTVNTNSLELIESISGERISLKFEPLTDTELRVIPEEKLQPSTSYWLMTHTQIKDRLGTPLSEGALSVVSTASVSGAVELDQSKFKAYNERNFKDYGLDYGYTIIDNMFRTYRQI
ncbi:MAG: S41 family peptidase [Desulfitobacterium hafniense]|nr:S41 family peptidase [Desulfitobacterium hafniense]